MPVPVAVEPMLVVRRRRGGETCGASGGRVAVGGAAVAVAGAEAMRASADVEGVEGAAAAGVRLATLAPSAGCPAGWGPARGAPERAGMAASCGGLLTGRDACGVGRRGRGDSRLGPDQRDGG